MTNAEKYADCGNKNQKELYNIYKFLPKYWERLKAMERCTSRLYKGIGITALEQKFDKQ